MFEQRLGVVGIARVEADADAGADVDLDSLDEKRRAQDRAQLARDDFRGTQEGDLLRRIALEIGKEDQELVAAGARDHIHLPDRSP